jgi:uncharacterized protein
MVCLVLRATERCNAHCAYCDVVFKQHVGASMPLAVLERVFGRADEYLRDQPGETLEILWHGGEPLTLGPDYFRAALEFQNRLCPETGPRISHRIQTNLTCFDEDFLDVFRRLGITSVGTSYDPEPGVRGLGRHVDTAAYNARFLKAVALLDRHGIGWGVIYVVTRRSIDRPLDAFFFMTNLKLNGGITFNPVLIYDDQRRDIAITPAE